MKFLVYKEFYIFQQNFNCTKYHVTDDIKLYIF